MGELKRVMIRDVPEEERPRERMIRLGADVLSNAELIAILLRTGTSSESVVELGDTCLIPNRRTAWIGGNYFQ